MAMPISANHGYGETYHYETCLMLQLYVFFYFNLKCYVMTTLCS